MSIAFERFGLQNRIEEMLDFLRVFARFEQQLQQNWSDVTMKEASRKSISFCRSRAILVTTFLMVGLVGCKDKLGPEPSEIYGFWTATKVEYVGKAGQGTVNASNAGWTATLTLNADNTGDLAVTPKDADTWHWAGAWEIDGDLFRIVGQGADIQLSGSTLYLTGFDGSYDFNADSELEPAKLNLVMVK